MLDDEKCSSNTQNQAGPLGMGLASACARQSAKGVLRDRIDRLRRELDALQVLHDSLPDAMLPKADEALWHILISSR